MPFELKNVEATYQRMMTRIFRDKIRSTVEVYIDDMEVKSREDQRHMKNLEEMFEIPRQYKLRLNIDKCAFEVGARKFLGYMIKKLRNKSES